MKLAVYSICKNEAQHVARYMRCAKDADGVFILDTGSTDGSAEAYAAAGACVERRTFDPWRFDDARNAAMDMVPPEFDVLVLRDMDEVVLPETGWRTRLEAAWPESPSVLAYANFVSTRKPDGTPDLEYWRCFAHTRDYRWTRPVHECLETNQTGSVIVRVAGVTVDHRHKDAAKDRSHYLALLEKAAREFPQDDRTAHYYARELYYRGRWKDAVAAFRVHLALPAAIWAAERAASCRYAAKCCNRLGDVATGEHAWLLRACSECPGEREPWVDLGLYYQRRRNWSGAYYAAKQALAIAEKRHNHYMTSAYAWNEGPWHILAVACWYLPGMRTEGMVACAEALKRAPDAKSIRETLTWYIKEA